MPSQIQHSKVDTFAFYGGQDPAELDIYSFAAAARYLGVPSSTVRWWVRGRASRGYEPVLATSSEEGLSFFDLLEVDAIHKLRRVHGVKLQAVRKAIEYAEGRLGIDRLLLRSDLSTFDGNIFIDHLGALVGLSAGGQVALRRIIERHLSRVERDETERPVRFYPDFVGVELTKNHRPISISPTVAFGRPTIAGTSLQTAVVSARVDAGETVAEVAEDYGIDPDAVTSAVIYENAA